MTESYDQMLKNLEASNERLILIERIAAHMSDYYRIVAQVSPPLAQDLLTFFGHMNRDLNLVTAFNDEFQAEPFYLRIEVIYSHRERPAVFTLDLRPKPELESLRDIKFD